MNVKIRRVKQSQIVATKRDNHGSLNRCWIETHFYFWAVEVNGQLVDSRLTRKRAMQSVRELKKKCVG